MTSGEATRSSRNPISHVAFDRLTQDLTLYSRDIFLGILGFRLTSDGEAITPPDIDERTEQGRLKRLRCIRCWLELAIWIEHFVKLRRDEVAKIKLSCPTRIRLIPAGPRLLEALQYHLPRKFAIAHPGFWRLTIVTCSARQYRPSRRRKYGKLRAGTCKKPNPSSGWRTTGWA